MSSNDENDEHQADLLSQEEEEPEKLNINKNKGDESSRAELLKKDSNSNKEPEPEQKNESEQEQEKENKHPEKEPEKEQEQIQEKEPKHEEKEPEQPKNVEKNPEEEVAPQNKDNEKASRKSKKKKSTKKQKDAQKEEKNENLKESKKDVNKNEDKLNKKGKEEIIDKNGKIIVANGMVKDEEGEGKKEGEGENQEEKKEGEEEKEGEEKEKELATVQEKIKFPITPYQVTGEYNNVLFSTLKKENRLRPTTLLAPEKFDITRDIGEILKEEEKINKNLEQENKLIEDREREDKIHLNKYKEQTLLGHTMIEDPMALFYGAKRVYIDQFYKLSDLFVICPIYYNYRISLCYEKNFSEGKEKNTAYHLFNTKEISPSCSHNCCPNQARQIDINIFNFILNSKDKRVQKFIKLTKKYRCAISCLCACCSRPTFVVETLIEMLGQIIETRTATDPVIHVLDINEDIIYIIKATFCQCGFCCRDECCGSQKCSSCEFTIYDEEGKEEKGKIKKGHRNGNKVLPDYDQIEVTFPEDASCQNKVLLMCAALVIEYLYFQNFSNLKRCNGKPKFENAYTE